MYTKFKNRLLSGGIRELSSYRTPLCYYSMLSEVVHTLCSLSVREPPVITKPHSCCAEGDSCTQKRECERAGEAC